MCLSPEWALSVSIPMPQSASEKGIATKNDFFKAGQWSSGFNVYGFIIVNNLRNEA